MHKEAMLYDKLEDSQVRCFLCSHHCRIKKDGFGVCRVRKNIKGSLKSLVYQKAIAAGADPIEKKPFYHFLPGSISYSVATAGCNFRCSFCQNWQISQVEENIFEQFFGQQLEPANIVKRALEGKCKSISYTYTEPTVFFEYAYDTAVIAQKKGLYNCWVTNGYMTKEALLKISPYLDAVNVDLKSFRDDFYQKKCGSRLRPVLEFIKCIKELGIWLEVTTLIVPGQNDSEKELTQIAQFIADLNQNIPWHISRFYPNYKDLDSQPTSLSNLDIAYQAGKKAGLNYVYLGNVSGEINTYCSFCQKRIIERPFLGASKINIKEKKCIFCSKQVSGIFFE